MRGRKGRVGQTMTCVTRLGIEAGDVLRMAVGTDERLTRDLEAVPLQGESHHLVREGGIAQLCQFCVRAAMLGVAMPAAQIRFVGQQ